MKKIFDFISSIFLKKETPKQQLVPEKKIEELDQSKKEKVNLKQTESVIKKTKKEKQNSVLVDKK